MEQGTVNSAAPRRTSLLALTRLESLWAHRIGQGKASGLTREGLPVRLSTSPLARRQTQGNRL